MELSTMQNGTCKCCGQTMRFGQGIEYSIDDSLFIDGVFNNSLPAVLGLVTFDDGAKIPCVLNRITEQFCYGTMGAANKKVKPITFKY